MKLQILTDNNTFIDQYYLGEPGASYYIEAGSLRILFDTGYSDVFLSNAAALKINLSRLTHIVISHGHNDHTGGLKYLAQSMDLTNVQLAAHPHCFNAKEERGESIGAPFTQQEIRRLTRYTPSSEPLWLSGDCVFLGQIPALFDFEAGRPIGRRNMDNAWEPDLLCDDSAMALRTSRGLFIVTGCSHSGICNIVEYAMQVCAERRIAGVLGGFHLFDCGRRLEQTIRYLESLKLPVLYPCHCVSLKVKARMLQTLPVEEAGVGLSVSIP